VLELNFRCQEPNPWDLYQSSGLIAWQVILVSAHLAAFVYTIYKLVILVSDVEEKEILFL
jgi:hypothetical protein